MAKQGVYEEPRIIEDLNQCFFYHTMHLPGIGTVRGTWDLNARLREYLGKVDFRGKRVLDVGCASGLLSFYMEQQGADVFSFDASKDDDIDLVPFAKWKEYEHICGARKTHTDLLNNSYWLAHRLLKSNAKVVYGSVYNIPQAIGPVDIIVYGCILLHPPASSGSIFGTSKRSSAIPGSRDRHRTVQGTGQVDQRTLPRILTEPKDTGT